MLHTSNPSATNRDEETILLDEILVVSTTIREITLKNLPMYC